MKEDIKAKAKAKVKTVSPGQSEPEPPPEQNGKPTAKFGPLSRMADRAAEILIDVKAPFYQRGDKLVRPVTLQAKTFYGKDTTASQLVDVDLHYLRDMLCKKSEWIKFDKRSRSWVSIHPPMDAALVLLKRFGDWTFPALDGIISCQTMRPDGTIISAEGYDPETRLLLIAPPTMEPIPEKPSKDDAQTALNLLKGLLPEFPFIGRDENGQSAALSVALSAILSTVCRGACPIVPVHVIDASAAGSGKSYLLSLVSYIATGQPMPVIGTGKSEEEMEKRIGAELIKGRSLVCLDNVDGELGGEAICQLTEQPRPQVRILGQSKSIEVEARSVTFFANGVNVVIVGQLCRRVVRSRLVPETDQPEMREFSGNPVRDILANRGEYIRAALVIVRAYITAGRPSPKRPQLNSYGEWSDTVRSALVWLGEEDPVKTMDTSRAEDPETSALITMLSEWKATFGVNGAATLKEVVDRCDRIRSIDPLTKAVQYEHQGLRTAVLAIMPRGRNQPDSEALGKWMRGKKDRRVNGMWFSNKPGSHGAGASWWVESSETAATVEKEEEEEDKPF